MFHRMLPILLLTYVSEAEYWKRCFLLSFQSTLDDATDDWGIKVERVEIKDVKLPVQLQRAMAAEAEAAREARAKVMFPACLDSVLFSSISFLKSTEIKTLSWKNSEIVLSV